MSFLACTYELHGTMHQKQDILTKHGILLGKEDSTAFGCTERDDRSLQYTTDHQG